MAGQGFVSWERTGSLVPVGLLERGTFCVLGMLVTYTASRLHESQQRLCRSGREVTFTQ